MTLENEYRKALKEIGPIVPRYSRTDKLYYFEHDLYPAVIGAASTKEGAVQNYQEAMAAWIKQRMAGQVADFMDKATSGRGGARPGAGRRRAADPMVAVRVHRSTLDVVNWLREDPLRAEQIRPMIRKGTC